MGYQVKWVIENLGISRKALRCFEKHGLMPMANNQVRNYSEDDIERIWLIRIFQGMGFSLKEIAAFKSDEDIQNKVKDKVAELEEKQKELEQLIGYAKYIKLTGKIPVRPKQMGTIKFDDFQKKSQVEWNVNTSPELKNAADVFESYLEMSEGEFTDSKLGQIIQLLESLDISAMGAEQQLIHTYLPRAIANRKALGANHPEVQLLVKMYFDEIKMQYEEFAEVSEDVFARNFSASYKFGDGAMMLAQTFGKEECEFIADAIAIFGGFENFDSI